MNGIILTPRVASQVFFAQPLHYLNRFFSVFLFKTAAVGVIGNVIGPFVSIVSASSGIGLLLSFSWI